MLPRTHTIHHQADGDLYEININSTERSVTLVRYRRSLDGPGEEVNFDELAQWVQDSIYVRVKHYLASQK